MILKSRLNYCVSFALAISLALALSAQVARAATITTPVSLPTGTFGAMMSGSGTAALTGASGTYKQHTGDAFGNHIYITSNISAANQVVGITMPNVNIANAVASGSANIDYDDVTPGTPIALNSLSADFNGAGGSNQNYGFVINVAPLNVTVGILGTFPLTLTMNGLITNALFNSTGGSPATPYAIPGILDLTLQGTISGVLNAGILGNINLGTLFTLPATTVPTVLALPGNMLLTDLTGGLGPYPANMQVDLAAAVFANVVAPLTLPFSTNQSFVLAGHASGFTSLNINAGSQLNASITLGNPGYSLSGVVPLALVPEPSSMALGLLAGLGLVGCCLRRRGQASARKL